MIAKKVAFSKPLTFRSDVSLPQGFFQLADEGRLSFTLGHVKKLPISEILVQAIVVWRLIKSRRGVDVIVTGRYGDLMALIQGFVPFGRKPLILLDVEWPSRRRPGIKKFISIALHRIIAKGASHIQVFCHSEIEEYSKYFGIDPAKFKWIPYCVDETDDEIPASEGSYIFSGGNHQRDYETLYRAVKDIPCEVRLAAPIQMIPEGLESSNITVLGRVPREAFFAQMAGAKLVVVSLQPGMMRSPGVITYVYAMKYGKCVIVNDPIGATSYIEHGVTGLIVRSSDAQALREEILKVLRNDELRRMLGRNAAAFCREHLSATNYLDALRSVVAECGVVRAGCK
jgi:glycosyltransferase involved in cell wall biosynthesis